MIVFSIINSPESWSNLVKQWEQGEKLESFKKYYRNKYHQNINDPCDDECRTEVLHSIQTAAKRHQSLSVEPKL